MSPTPYRYAEKSVYRYIQILHTIQDNPVPVRLEFHPDLLGVNSETAACRLRDAAHSLSVGLTTHPLINPTLLAERFRLYRISHDGTKVFVIPKTEKKIDNTSPLSIDQQSGDVLARVESTDSAIISAFALLLGRHILQGRVEIVGELREQEPFVLGLQDSHDISITTIDPNLHIMF